MSSKGNKASTLRALAVWTFVAVLTVFNAVSYWKTAEDRKQLEAEAGNILLQSWVREYAKTHHSLPSSIEASFPSYFMDLWPASPYTRQPIHHIQRSDSEYVGNFTYFQFVKGNGYGDVIVSYVPRSPLTKPGVKFDSDLEFLSAYSDSHYNLIADGLSPQEVFSRLQSRGWKGLKEPAAGILRFD